MRQYSQTIVPPVYRKALAQKRREQRETAKEEKATEVAHGDRGEFFAPLELRHHKGPWGTYAIRRYYGNVEV